MGSGLMLLAEADAAMSTGSIATGAIAVLGALATFLGGIAGWWSTKGVDAQIRLMQARKETNLDALHRAEQELADVKVRMDVLTSQYEACRKEHVASREQVALLTGRLESVERLLAAMNTRNSNWQKETP